MAVWGIGAYFLADKPEDIPEDHASDFCKYEVAVLGYTEEQKPDYYDVMEKMKVGDLIYIKTRFMADKPLKVKAIGIVTNAKILPKDALKGKKGVDVHWIKKSVNHPIEIKAKPSANSVRTIFEEKNDDVIREIISHL